MRITRDRTSTPPPRGERPPLPALPRALRRSRRRARSELRAAATRWPSRSPSCTGTSAGWPTRWRSATTSASTCSCAAPRCCRSATRSSPRSSGCCAWRSEGVAGQLPELLGAAQPRRRLLLAVRRDADGAAAERRDRWPDADRGDGRAARAARAVPDDAGVGRGSATRRCAGMRLAAGRRQRYCLTCGARAGERSPRLSALLARIPALGGGARAETPPATAAAVAPASRCACPAAHLGAAGARVPRLRRAARQRRRGRRARLRRAPRGCVVPVSTRRRRNRRRAPPAKASRSRRRRTARTRTRSDAGSRRAERRLLHGRPAQRRRLRRAAGERGRRRAARDRARAPPRRPAKLTAIKHVFLIVLSDQPYAAVFGPESAAHYLVAHARGARASCCCATTPSPTSSCRTRSRC